jgi:predicted nucleic acid-binding protein
MAMVERSAGWSDVILADTGFWLALANRRDTHHARAKEALAVRSGAPVRSG